MQTSNFPFCEITSDIKDISLHLLSDLIFATIIGIIEYFRYFFQLKRKFDKTHFNVYRKGHNNNLVREIDCEVKWHIGHANPKIIYRGIESSDKRAFAGEFFINPINLKVGEGVHYHYDYDGFNFPKLVIKDDETIYVETSYITATENQEGFFEQKFQAYVWRKV